MKIAAVMLPLAAVVLLINTRSERSQAFAQTQSNVIRFVSIFDSPAVPDLGAHSVIGGILTGRGLTAILPNLKICAWPKGANPSAAVCTAVCKPGHQCLNKPFSGRGVTPDPRSHAVTVNVRNVDRPGSEHSIVTFDIDASTCTASNHCKVAVAIRALMGTTPALK